jgi:hypothetical protein
MFGVWPRNLADNRPEAPSQKTMKFIDKKLREFRKQTRGY